MHLNHGPLSSMIYLWKIGDFALAKPPEPYPDQPWAILPQISTGTNSLKKTSATEGRSPKRTRPRRNVLARFRKGLGQGWGGLWEVMKDWKAGRQRHEKYRKMRFEVSSGWPYLPTITMENHQMFTAKSTISMAIFKSFFDITRGYIPFRSHEITANSDLSTVKPH